MSRFVRIAAVQFETQAQRGAPDAQAKVLEELERKTQDLKGFGLDLAVFCEGVEAFSQSVDQAEDPVRPGPVLQRYMALAREARCHVAASVKTRVGGRAHNSIAFVDVQGELRGVYHKTFLTHKELNWGLSPGSGAVTVETSIGRLGGAVCFDLNYEELRHQYRTQKLDILCFASMYHGGLVQPQWAYECRSFFVAALPFLGAGVLDPLGRTVAQTDCYTRIAMTSVNLDRVLIHLDFNASRFNEIRRKYLGEVEIDIPPNIGCALLYSLTEKRSAMDVVREFELELLDDYFARARRDNAAQRATPLSADR